MSRGCTSAVVAWTLFLLRLLSFADSLVLLIFAAHLRLYDGDTLPAAFAAAAWAMLIAMIDMVVLASSQSRTHRLGSTFWWWILICADLIAAALFGAAIGTTFGSLLAPQSSDSQQQPPPGPTETDSTTPEERWLTGAMILEGIGCGLALIFMLIGCIGACRKPRA
jgi:hypothetical protein